MLTPYLSQLSHQKNLSVEDAYNALMTIFTGECSHNEIVQLLALLSEKGESVSEIVGFTRALREKALRVDLGNSLFDTCGTGGTNQDRFNVSTACAFVLSAAGIPVAKHGNRGSQKSNGSFDFLDALGISFELTPNRIQAVFHQTNLAFLFARQHHTAMKYVVEARKELARRTIFNLIGPLSNPASVDYQIIGTTAVDTAEKLAQAIQQLGTIQSYVVVGGDGSDELSLAGDSALFSVTPDAITQQTISPAQLGITDNPVSVGTATENATLFAALAQSGDITHPNTHLICLNAGAAMQCCRHAADIDTGYEQAIAIWKTGNVYRQYLTYKNAVSVS